jgi:hypothetical protein
MPLTYANDPYAAARIATEIDLVKAAHPGCYTLAGVPYVATTTPQGVVLQKAGRVRSPSPGQMGLFAGRSPRVGDTKVDDGVAYQLNRNSRWVRADKGKGMAAKPAAIAVLRDEPEPVQTPVSTPSNVVPRRPKAKELAVSQSPYEASNLFGGKKWNLGLNLHQNPSGSWGFVGKVPADLAFIDPTPKQLEGLSFGEKFGPKKRRFATADEAREFARNLGHEFSESVKPDEPAEPETSVDPVEAMPPEPDAIAPADPYHAAEDMGGDGPPTPEPTPEPEAEDAIADDADTAQVKPSLKASDIQYQGKHPETDRHHIYVGDDEYTFELLERRIPPPRNRWGSRSGRV